MSSKGMQCKEKKESVLMMILSTHLSRFQIFLGTGGICSWVVATSVQSANREGPFPGEGTANCLNH